MYNPYDDEGLVEWVENTERGMLELAFMDLVREYVILKRELKQLVSNVSWERTARQQERSGGCM